MSMLKRFWKDESGADATEYALLAALVAVGIIGGASSLGGKIHAVHEHRQQSQRHRPVIRPSSPDAIFRT